MSAGVIMKRVVVMASVSGRPSAMSSSTVRAKLSRTFWRRSGAVKPFTSACRG
jgi:hypothetical protein